MERTQRPPLTQCQGFGLADVKIEKIKLELNFMAILDWFHSDDTHMTMLCETVNSLYKAHDH